MGQWLATILTLGLLWPRMTFWLDKYRTDRTFYGSARLHRGGSKTMLFPKLRHLVFGLVLIAIGSGLAFADLPQALWLLVCGIPWALYG